MKDILELISTIIFIILLLIILFTGKFGFDYCTNNHCERIEIRLFK